MSARSASIGLLLIALLLSSVLRAPARAAAIDDFSLPDHLGKKQSLADLADKQVVVVAFLGTQCPLAKLYATRLQSIANDFADRGVAVVAVMSNAQDSISARTDSTSDASPRSSAATAACDLIQNGQ